MSEFVHRPRILVASETPHFHQFVRQHITLDDFVLEIGCSFGACTQILVEIGCRGVAVDNSGDAVTKTRALMADSKQIIVEQADARDMGMIYSLCPEPSAILFDVGGNEPLDKISSLTRLLLKTFRPRVLIIKSMELAELMSIVEDYTLPNQPHLLTPPEDTLLPHQLLDLTYSPVMNDRLFALAKAQAHHPSRDRQNTH